MKARLTTALAFACLSMGSLPAPAAPPLADKLPAGSLVYVAWAGRSLTFDGSMFGQLLNDPGVGRIFSALRSGLEKEIGEGEEREAFGHAWEMARIAWQHPLAVALIDLKPGQREPLPEMAAVIDLGKDVDEFRKHLDGLLALAKDEVQFTEAAAGQVKYYRFQPRGGPQLAYGFLGNLMFWAVGEGVPERLAQLAAPKALPADKKFAACMKSVTGKDVQLAYYADVAGIVERLGKLLPPDKGGEGGSPARQVQKLVDAIGLGKVTAAAGAVHVVDRGMYGKARLFSPAPHQGVLLPLAGTPITDADLAGVPEDTDVLAVVKLSPSAAYAELRRAIKAVEPEADQQFAQAMGQLEEELGFSLTRDVFPSLGDTWVLASAPSQGGFLTGTLLTAAVKDAPKLAAAIKKVEARAAQEGPKGLLQTVKEGRTEIRYLALGATGETAPVAPAWALHKGRFYLAAFPQVIQSAVAENGKKSVAQSPAFRAARGRIAGKPSILLYANPPKIVEQVYHWALIGWTLAANALTEETGVPVQPSWLPPMSSIKKYLWPQVCAVSSDPKGITVESYGSLPPVSVVAPLLLNPAPVWGAVPMYTSARRSAQATMEMSDLRQVSMALMMYQVDQGKMPASLKEPKLNEYLGGGRLKEKLAAGLYSYLPPSGNKGQAPAPRTILVYLPVGPGRPVVLAAFADGHVERMPPARFEQMLKAQLDGDAAPAGPVIRR